nr:RNA-dependent RNA polymerase [Cnidium virus Z]
MPNGWTLRLLRYTGKKDLGKVLRLTGPGWNYPISYFASCSSNLIRGLVMRVLSYKGGPIIAPKPGSWSRLAKRTIRGLKVVGLRPTAPMSADSWLACYRGRKQTIYRKALESLSVKALGDRDFEVKAFIKKDKDKIPIGDTTSDPRIIQPRDPRVTVTFGPYIRAIEKKLYKHFASLWRSIAMSTATPVCFKGFNYSDRGVLMKKKWDSFIDPVAVALDASRFDLHVSVDALKFTDELYRGCFHREYWPSLDYILSRRHKTYGVASCKESVWRYSKEGGRCSGDVDTSLGNVCIMLAVSVRIADIMNCHIELANDGDDQIFFVERSDLDALLGVIEPTFEEFGLRVKVEPPVDILERVDFCQTRPVLSPSGYRMVRYPTLAMTKDLSSFLPIDRVAVARNMCQAIGDCGWAAFSEMPVLGQFYDVLRKVGGNAESHWRQSGVDLGFLYHVKDLESPTSSGFACPNPEVRVSFFKAFGMSPAEQIALEDEIRGWKIEFGPPEAVPRPSWWWWLGRDHNDASSLVSVK